MHLLFDLRASVCAELWEGNLMWRKLYVFYIQDSLRESFSGSALSGDEAGCDASLKARIFCTSRTCTAPSCKSSRSRERADYQRLASHNARCARRFGPVVIG